MAIELSSRAHLARAKEHAAASDPHRLLYAALELRLSIEARLHDYAERAGEFIRIPDNVWQIKELRKRVSSVFSASEKPLSLRLVNKKDKKKVEIFYVPVSTHVQKIGQRLGDYLHSASLAKLSKPAQFDAFCELVKDGIMEMEFVHTGILRGPPLQRGDGSITLSLEMGHQPEADALVSAVGDEALIEMRVVVTEKTPNGIKIRPA
ncbi:hypothetical protein SAMN05660653_00536 [Desulfonatronum thiosulfatophilum]|uniref:Uncharacterized protein n=1 Tax=Desulfonatronum thiosulfatophilum TaxID=617002 RepID=A0A1G6ASU3_9BACT|nr:hypothetical protein [Desulfonatronum thiosulfatophilum]SDB11437.1 hypothetical protein SAMN05660653_00536 [Desulfonatronum thiosulfatophilum]